MRRRRSIRKARARPHNGAENSLRRALRALDAARRMRVPTGPVKLSARYLRWVRLQESWPENREGADKSWVERSLRAYRRHVESVRLAD